MKRPPVTQYSVPLPDKPGMLHKVTQALHKEEINLCGIMTESLGNVAYVHFLAEKENNIPKLLKTAGFQVFESPAFWLELPNRPGELNKLAKRLGDEGINILHVYGTTNGGETARIALVVSEPEKARPILADWTQKAYATHN